MDWTNKNTIRLFARVQNATHVGTDIIYGVVLTIDIVDSDEITFQLHGDTTSRGHVVGLCRFYESRFFSIHRCCLDL
jgi:hypothetical protein